MNTFLILGGTGKVGRRLAAILSSQGHEPRTAARRGADVAFDWHRPETYDAALAGVTGVFIVGPGSATDWSPALTDLLTRASAAGVERAVLLSARAVEFLPEGAVGQSERALKAGPLAWTILRPTHFAQNFTEAMFAPKDGVISAPVGGAAHPFIDVSDLAEVAAVALTTPTLHGTTIELSGPEAVSFDEVAAALESRLGRPVSYEAQPREEHVAELVAAGTPPGYVTWRMAMLDAIARGDDRSVSDGVQSVLGRPATSVADWAAREAPVSTTGAEALS